MKGVLSAKNGISKRIRVWRFATHRWVDIKSYFELVWHSDLSHLHNLSVVIKLFPFQVTGPFKVKTHSRPYLHTANKNLDNPNIFGFVTDSKSNPRSICRAFDGSIGAGAFPSKVCPRVRHPSRIELTWIFQ